MPPSMPCRLRRPLAPHLAALHDALRGAGAAPALLCGSGSAFCAIAADSAAADDLAAQAPHLAPGALVLRARFPGAGSP